MEVLGWILAAVFAAIAGYLALRPNPYSRAVERLVSEVRSGTPARQGGPEDPAEVADLREALERGGRAEETDRDPGDEALRGLFRYVKGAVLQPLEESLARPGAAGDVRLQSAVDALRDLEFYAIQDRTHGGSEGEVAPEEGRDRTRQENLPTVVQAVTREYTRESGVAVRFNGPPGAVRVRIDPERFKDALYLLLANAGHFGGGGTVEVEIEADTDTARLRVRDRGAGFSNAALDHAFDPFWSTEPDALGLGLTHARRVLAVQGATIRIGNLEGGGGEALVVLSRSP